MERSNIIKRIKSKTTTIDLFNYDSLSAPPLLSLLSYEDIEYFRRLATSIRYSGKIDYKYSEIDKVMKSRGFVKMGAGTNRVVYRHLEIDTIVVKIAIDAVGVKDNPREYENQFYLKQIELLSFVLIVNLKLVINFVFQNLIQTIQLIDFGIQLIRVLFVFYK